MPSQDIQLNDRLIEKMCEYFRDGARRIIREHDHFTQHTSDKSNQNQEANHSLDPHSHTELQERENPIIQVSWVEIKQCTLWRKIAGLIVQILKDTTT
jgi:hypothetical protein